MLVSLDIRVALKFGLFASAFCISQSASAMNEYDLPSDIGSKIEMGDAHKYVLGFGAFLKETIDDLKNYETISDERRNLVKADIANNFLDLCPADQLELLIQPNENKSRLDIYIKGSKDFEPCERLILVHINQSVVTPVTLYEVPSAFAKEICAPGN